jgi:sialate O-acetylesterase
MSTPLSPWYLLSVLICVPLVADVRLPALFGDHMVLQQDIPLPIWGWAEPGEAVTVTVGELTGDTIADATGAWRLDLPALPSSAAGRTLTVKGRNTVRYEDVVVGEVWIASGQSNMAFHLNSAHTAANDLPKASDPEMRLFVVQQRTASATLNDVRGHWQRCNPDSARRFSAVAYYFGRDLRQALGRPVGLICSAWGGTGAETWISLQALSEEPPLTRPLAAWKAALKAEARVAAEPELMAGYERDLQLWQKEVAPKFNAAMRAFNEARAKGDLSAIRPAPERPEPRNPDPMGMPNPSARPSTPTVTFNGMIAPLMPFAIRGVLWYQGEGNVTQPVEYAELFPRLIRDWRRRWGQADFPFLFVQIPNWERGSEDTSLPQLREAQRLASVQVPRTAMAVTIDIGDPHDVHPTNKVDVGRRLALLARRDVYGERIVARGPIFARATPEGANVRLHFTSEGSRPCLGQAPWRAAGVQPYPAYRLIGFEVRDETGRWREAAARLDEGTVVVTHPEGAKVRGVRYAWTSAPRGNLYNPEGLPAAPFRWEYP